MIRQWCYLKTLKHGAHGYEKNRIARTTPRSCAVECSACPNLNKNMPENWKNTPDNKKYISLYY